MLKRKLLLVILTIPHLYCGSQTISTITPEQIRIANQIFVEHKYLKNQEPLLKQEISNLKQINTTWEHTDSLKNIMLADKDKSVKTYKKITIVSIIATFLCLLIK